MKSYWDLPRKSGEEAKMHSFTRADAAEQENHSEGEDGPGGSTAWSVVPQNIKDLRRFHQPNTPA